MGKFILLLKIFLLLEITANTTYGLLLYLAILLSLLTVITVKVYLLLLQSTDKNKGQLLDIQQLEEKISQRTALLEDKNKDLEHFNYIVSHDLKAPLKNIKGLIGILKTEVSDEHKVTVTHIATMANRMEKLISTLFLFSKAQQLSIQKKAFNLEAILQECYEELKKEYHHKTIKFELQSIPTAYGDKAAIRQVCLNLLSNALKYASKNDIIKIVVFAKQHQQQLVVGIKDNGTGFNEEEKDKLFQRFQRLHKPSEYEGTGLGLAICQQIIEKHNGKIWAENNRRSGATFYISLPLATTNLKEESKQRVITSTEIGNLGIIPESRTSA